MTISYMTCKEVLTKEWKLKIYTEKTRENAIVHGLEYKIPATQWGSAREMETC